MCAGMKDRTTYVLGYDRFITRIHMAIAPFLERQKHRRQLRPRRADAVEVPRLPVRVRAPVQDAG